MPLEYLLTTIDARSVIRPGSNAQVPKGQPCLQRRSALAGNLVFKFARLPVVNIFAKTLRHRPAPSVLTVVPDRLNSEYAVVLQSICSWCAVGIRRVLAATGNHFNETAIQYDGAQPWQPPGLPDYPRRPNVRQAFAPSAGYRLRQQVRH